MNDEQLKFLEKVNKTGTCWLWEGALNDQGYGRYYFRGKAKQRAHRVSYELFVGPIPDKILVCHRCDVPNCVNPDHLFLGTQNDNLKDMTLKKRRACGEAVISRGNAKINFFIAEVIRKSYREGSSKEYLSQRFGISISSVTKIIRRETWSS